MITNTSKHIQNSLEKREYENVYHFFMILIYFETYEKLVIILIICSQKEVKEQTFISYAPFATKTAKNQECVLDARKLFAQIAYPPYIIHLRVNVLPANAKFFNKNSFHLKSSIK